MHQKIITFMLGLAIALVMGVCWQVTQVPASIAALIRMREDKVGTVKAEWKSGGVTIHFESTRMSNETAEEAANRAARELAAYRAAFPEDH